MKKRKQIIEKILNYIIKICLNLKEKLQIEKIEELLNITHLNSIKLDVDEISNYTKVIKWGVDQEEVKNIALTGSYGTGKSSILKSFIDFYNLKKTLTISLANFETSDISNELIEFSIVNQIIYSEKSSKLNDSRFKRIQYVKHKWFKSLLISIFIYSIIYLFFDDINNSIALVDSYSLTSSFFKSFFIFSIVAIIYNLYNEIVNFRISKISPTDIEISKDSNERDSILSQYFDEILNFFYKTKTNIVLIEDLDRFENSIQVFTKLREINELLNTSKELKCGKITFIYAIKDEFIESSYNKTKFFDLIVPILPFINYNTSREFIFDKISKIDVKFKDNNLLKELIKDTSIYINDTRTALNIINEFVIMKNQYNKHWNENELSDQDIYKIFALSIYKNCYSKDFSLLLDNNPSSIFYSVILKKDSFLIETKEDYENDINLLQIEIDKINDEHINIIEEINRLFVHELVLHFSKSNIETLNLSITNDDITILNLHEIENFETIFKEIKYKERYGSGFKKSGHNFQKLESTLNINYNDRVQAINNKVENKIKDIDKKINEKKISISKLKAKPIREIIKRKSDAEIFEKIGLEIDHQKNTKLLLILIKNGYIDESYLNYISYKHSGLLNIDDLIFRNRIQSDDEPEPLKKINNIKVLLDDLSLNHFNNKTIFNYYILEYLLNHQNQLSDQIDIFFKNLNEQTRLSKDFILDAIPNLEKQTSVILFEKLLEDSSLWNIVGLESNEKTNKILSLILNVSNTHIQKNRLEKINSEGKLLEYLKADNSIINSSSKDLIFNLNALYHYKIDSFNVIKNNKQITEFVYDNNFYRLNQDNLQFVMLNILNEKTVRYDLTFLQLKHSLTPLYKYIKQDMDFYLENIYFNNVNQENNENDEINDLIFFNIENISPENKNRFIKEVAFKINLLNLIKNKDEIIIELQLITDLIKYNRLICNWNTIETILENQVELDLIYSFMNQNILSLSNDKHTFEDDALIIEMVDSNNIVDYSIFDNCTFLLSDITEIYEKIDFMDYIIKNDKIQYSQENFDFLTYPHQINFLEKLHVTNKSLQPIKFDSSEASNILLHSNDDLQQLITIEMLNDIGIVEYGDADVVIKFINNIIKYKIKTVSLPLFKEIFKSKIDDTKKIEFLNYILLNRLVLNIKEVKLFIEDIEMLKNINKKEEFKCILTDETRILFPLLRRLRIIKMEYISEKNKHITVKF